MADEVHQVTIRGDSDALRKAADAVEGKSLQAGVRGFVIPEDADAYGAAIDNGSVAVLHAAGFTICAARAPEPALAKGESAAEDPDVGARISRVVA